MSEIVVDATGESDGYAAALGNLQRRHHEEEAEMKVRHEQEFIALALEYPGHQGAQGYIKTMSVRPKYAKIIEEVKNSRSNGTGHLES